MIILYYTFKSCKIRLSLEEDSLSFTCLLYFDMVLLNLIVLYLIGVLFTTLVVIYSNDHVLICINKRHKKEKEAKRAKAHL